MPTITKIDRPWLKKAEKATIGQGRANPNRDVYGSWRWTKLSKRYRESHPLCVICKAEGRITPSKVVDHIKPINSGNVDPYDESNWAPLCISCHNKKSSKEGREQRY